MPDPGGVPVPDVIQQIKCELMHAIAAPMKNRDIAWFQNFAAKIDLTLNVGTVNQLNPTVVFNNPLHNAYPNVGPSSLGGSTVSAVAQKFTFGVGGGFADTRARAEDMTFTVGFKDLKRDFERLSSVDPRFRECLDPMATLTYSNLDLKSWMDRRVLPLVEPNVTGYRILYEGHAVIAASAAGHPATPPAIVKPYDLTPGIPDALRAATFATQASEYVTKQLLPIAQKLGPVCSNDVLAYSTSVADAAVVASQKSQEAVTAHLRNGRAPDATETNAIKAATSASETAETISKKAYDTLRDRAICALAPPAPKAPPFDTISANYTFSVSANVGIAPSWTLVHVTGPSGTGSAASTAAAWTNNLSIILAPTAPSTSNPDVNYQRLIQSLRPPLPPNVAAPF
jgi:hypothetical protein